MRSCLFGIPGAGKSHCIKLVRRFFEECLRWEDGVQFQFVASQNTMAALIDGKTVHTWGVIPVNAADAQSKIHTKSTDGDIDELFLNALGIRWLIIDECSTMSPGLLGLLDAYLRRACMRHPYAYRGGERRPFGGINIIFAGDLWQLPPVRAIAFFANPFKSGYSPQEQKIFKIFWDKSEDSIQRMFELTKSIRTPDPWLKAVLHAMARRAGRCIVFRTVSIRAILVLGYLSRLRPASISVSNARACATRGRKNGNGDGGGSCDAVRSVANVPRNANVAAA